MEARILETNDRYYLIQVKCEQRSLASLRPQEIVEGIRTSLSEKIADLLFEKIEPKILEILESTNDDE